MTEKELILRIQSNDHGAFDTLVRERYATLISYAHLFLRGEWAEDVVQDVFFSVWRNRMKLDARKNIQSYLLRSVYNRCLTYLEKGRSAECYRSYYQTRTAELIGDSSSPDANPVIVKIFDTELHMHLEKAISSLPKKCQEVFRLSYLEDLPDKKIAERLNISLSTVENHMYNALKQLRLKLAEI